MALSELLEQISTEQYKMPVILDNNREPDKIIKALEKKGWQAYDITAAFLKMLEDYRVVFQSPFCINGHYHPGPDSIVVTRDLFPEAMETGGV